MVCWYCTSIGWKIHRLTKKELCHSNETWHALNSTFPDTNCIVSSQINPQWIRNLGLWKVVLETFQNGLENWCRSIVLFHQDNAPAHKSVVAMAAVCDCGFELVDHPPCSPDLASSDYILFPNMKRIIGPVETGLPSSIFQAVHEMQLVSGKVEFNTRQVSLLWHNSSLVSLWTFQPTLVKHCDETIPLFSASVCLKFWLIKLQFEVK